MNTNTHWLPKMVMRVSFQFYPDLLRILPRKNSDLRGSIFYPKLCGGPLASVAGRIYIISWPLVLCKPNKRSLRSVTNSWNPLLSKATAWNTWVRGSIAASLHNLFIRMFHVKQIRLKMFHMKPGKVYIISWLWHYNTFHNSNVFICQSLHNLLQIM